MSDSTRISSFHNPYFDTQLCERTRFKRGLVRYIYVIEVVVQSGPAVICSTMRAMTNRRRATNRQ